MIALLERLLPLWTEPVDGRGDPEAAFGEVYADPVAVNGTEMSLNGAWSPWSRSQQAFDQLGMDILDTVETPDRVVVAFEMRGRLRSARTPRRWAPSRRPDAASRSARSTCSRSLEGWSPRSGWWPTTSACSASSTRPGSTAYAGTRQRSRITPDGPCSPPFAASNTFARARHTDTRRPGLALIHIRHRKLDLRSQTCVVRASGVGCCQ